MKNLAASLLVLLISVAFASAQTKEEKKFSSFSRIQLRSGSKVFLRQGSTQKVEIEGNREDIEDLDPRVEGDKFIIGRDGWNNNWGFSTREDRVVFYITVPNIESLNVSGSGDLVAETKFTTRDLDLSVSGSGSLLLEADASGDLGANVSGSGRIEFKGKCRDFDSHVSGSGKIKLDIEIAERAVFGLSGSGKVEAKGSAKEVKATISGSGEVLAANMITDKCDVRISGSGDVEINVNKELDANISGSGTVSYKGNPAHVNSHSSGSGSVRKF
ncbi:MAG TPA: head GIN domain-containing protein [Cyclobacteriaceae bacterium]|nr:head GIN domain-containing protein [Cyclobacteriaceae bacterium]